MGDRDRAQKLLEATSDLVWFVDRLGAVTSANDAARQLLGWDAGTGILPASSAFTVASRAVVEVDAVPKLQATGSWNGDLTLRSAEGDAIPVSVVMVAGRDDDGSSWTAVVARDLRKARSLELQVRFQATHDSLTGLSNRDGLETAANVALAHRGAAVLICDVDHLKLVNDAMGFPAGDAVLVQVASRLRDCLRDEDLAARTNGDEFVVLLPGASAGEAAAVAERILERLAIPHDLCERRLTISATIGIAHADGADGQLARMLQQAEMAMYLAKQSRIGGYEVYDSDLHRRIVERSRLRQDLEQALERSEFFLLYQPVVSLDSERVSSVEALLRWQHPQLGTIGPDVFIPLLEETGWIVPVGAWVLDRALQQLAEWQEQQAWSSSLAVNVNVSAIQLEDRLVDVVQDALDRHGVAPERLTVELTETVVAGDPQGAARVLSRLRDHGVRVALDDFGTGHSSLASLQSLPIDQLKIDRSFVVALAASGDPTLTTGICEIAMALGLQSVAEGIETTEQAEQLRAVGCTSGQGFHWARPLPADQVLGFARGSFASA